MAHPDRRVPVSLGAVAARAVGINAAVLVQNFLTV